MWNLNHTWRFHKFITYEQCLNASIVCHSSGSHHCLPRLSEARGHTSSTVDNRVGRYWWTDYSCCYCSAVVEGLLHFDCYSVCFLIVTPHLYAAVYYVIDTCVNVYQQIHGLCVAVRLLQEENARWHVSRQSRASQKEEKVQIIATERWLLFRWLMWIATHMPNI